MDSALVSHLSRTIRPAAGAGSRLRNPDSPVVFVSGYFSFMLKGEANVVEPVKQTISLEIINVEPGGEPCTVPYQSGVQIDSKLISIPSSGSVHQAADFGIAENNRQQAILHAVVPEDVGKRRRDDCAESIICQRPRRMFA